VTENVNKSFQVYKTNQALFLKN